jgi:hypothetical protein
MQSRRNARSTVIGLTEAAVLGACLAVAVAVGTSSHRPTSSEAGMQAWSARLQGQAEVYEQARIQRAVTDRLQAQADAYAKARIQQAATDRLQGLAGAFGVVPASSHSSDRAMDAWAERLDGLAKEYLAGQ